MSGHVVPISFISGFFWADGAHGATTGVRLSIWASGIPSVALAIAVTKMLLVVLFFMHVKYIHGLTRS